VAIKDFQFSADFNDSIEAKVRAQQESLRALNEKQKRITEAEAGAREMELQADAQAYQIEKESVSRAAAIEREAAALAKNPGLISLRAIERWDGVLPRFSGGAQPMPFIDVERFASSGK
jgi:regulator of protease activity HflC (stomatin/prohibitin superfamily)